MDEIERRLREGLSHTFDDCELMDDAEAEIKEAKSILKARALGVVFEVLKSTLGADKTLMNIIYMSIRASGELALRRIDSIININK
ncbi:hypothetical protein [Candidatus Borreliella tachyglossi]|uniref:hypothetical protein n=1 Tax=Candidatus Borreliella tachyglossi TaxID=1964448 RepID=UPI0040424472